MQLRGGQIEHAVCLQAKPWCGRAKSLATGVKFGASTRARVGIHLTIAAAEQRIPAAQAFKIGAALGWQGPRRSPRANTWCVLAYFCPCFEPLLRQTHH